MFMVPMRQQSPHPGAQQKLVGRAGVSAALPGVLALGESRAPLWGAGMVVPGMGTEPGQGPAVPAGWFAAPSLPAPMARISPTPALAWLPAFPGGVLLPHTTVMRKKNKTTYQLTPLYQ